MKTTHSLIIIVLAIIFPANCFASGNISAKMVRNQQRVNTSPRRHLPQKYVKSFLQYGFSITSPVPLSDASTQIEGDFLVNYAGYQDKYSETAAFYQIIAFRLPTRAPDYLPSRLKYIFKKYMESYITESFLSIKAIGFGDESYPGYEVTAISNGYDQKGIFFLKGAYVIALTVITNYNMDIRFNSFINGFMSLY